MTERTFQASYRRPRSRAAQWAFRLATFATVYHLILVLFRRTGYIDAIETFWLLAVGVALLVASVLFAFRAFADLWTYGFKGGRMTVRAFLLTGLVAIPYVVFAIRSIVYPALHDISTDPFNPPPLVHATQIRALSENRAMNPIKPATEAGIIEQLSAYPRLGSRRYPASLERVLNAALELAEVQGWVVVRTAGFELAGAADAADEAEEEGNAGDLAPGSDIADINDGATPDGENGLATLLAEEVSVTIELVESSFLMKFKSDIAIRLTEEDEFTLVDMRSSSRWGAHDFGTNAERVSGFLTDLDENLQGVHGE